jgi:hypothetical protein
MTNSDASTIICEHTTTNHYWSKDKYKHELCLLHSEWQRESWTVSWAQTLNFDHYAPALYLEYTFWVLHFLPLVAGTWPPTFSFCVIFRQWLLCHAFAGLCSLLSIPGNQQDLLHYLNSNTKIEIDPRNRECRISVSLVMLLYSEVLILAKLLAERGSSASSGFE